MTPLVVATLGLLGGSLFSRRIAWNCLGERPITVAVGLITLSISMLIPPLSVPLNNFGHALTGTWNAQGLIAHALCICADGAIVYHLAWRAQRENDFQRSFRAWVQLPGTLALALMFALWLSGNGSEIPVTYFYLVPTDLTVQLYWLVFCVTLAWMMGYATRWMFVLRQDPRSRPIVNIYIFASINGLIALLLRAIQAVAPPLLSSGTGMALASIFGCTAVAGFAIGAARSWSLKQMWLRPRRPEPPRARIKYSPRVDVSPF